VKPTPLSPEKMRNACDPEQFAFETSAEVDVLEGVIEQERAVRSLKTGLDIDKRNYNLFVAGASGTGRTTIVLDAVREAASARQTPDDWVYVHNFLEKETPRAMPLPAGKGRQLSQDMDWLIATLKEALPKAFREREHQEEIQEVVSSSLSREHEFFSGLSKRAKDLGFLVKSTKTGLITIPLSGTKALSNQEYDALSDEQKKEIEQRRRELDPSIHEFVSKTRDIEAETQEDIKKRQLKLARKVSGKPLSLLRRRYGKFNGLKAYFDAVQAHILDNVGKFIREEPRPVPPGEVDREFVEYKVNVVVDNGTLKGAPVLVEPRPSYYNLFGKIEKKVENGVYFTDFTMVKAGSVLKANGGYLVINTNDLFSYGLVWENLKTILRYRQSTIEDLGEHLGYLPTSGLRPEPIPISLKIILIGPPHVYELLYRYDEDFRKLFQIKSEFDYEMARSRETMLEYARFVATTCKNDHLRPVTRNGVACIVDVGSRLVESQDRVTLQFNQVCNILIEADRIAAQAGSDVIHREHVKEAVRQRDFRLSLLEEKVRQEIVEGSVLIDVKGERVGMLNGLAVYEVGDYLFGKPSRISAATYAGKTGVVNVEREARLSGAIHSKGVLIISGFLGATFGRTRSLSLTVSVCFEQSYGLIDGDSASCAELYAILSSLTGLPIRQDIAVTGSVNQQGDVQPVGGINEKIEAWFNLCKEKGLSGTQGVHIPAANVKNLMLKDEVVDAVRDGKFFIYPVSRVEEGIEILMGRPAGTLDERMRFTPEESVFALAGRTLDRFEEIAEGGDEGRSGRGDSGEEIQE